MIYFRCDEKINISKATKYSFQIIGLKPTDSSTYASCVQGLPTVTFELPCSYVTPKVQVHFYLLLFLTSTRYVSTTSVWVTTAVVYLTVCIKYLIIPVCRNHVRKMSEFKGHALKRFVKLGNLCTQYAYIVRPRADLI